LQNLPDERATVGSRDVVSALHAGEREPMHERVLRKQPHREPEDHDGQDDRDRQRLGRNERERQPEGQHDPRQQRR